MQEMYLLNGVITPSDFCFALNIIGQVFSGNDSFILQKMGGFCFALNIIGQVFSGNDSFILQKMGSIRRIYIFFWRF